MDSTHEPPLASYPPAPWRSGGTMWIALLPTTRPVPVPEGLTPVGKDRLVLMVIRYRTGTLCYDELIIGRLVRHNRRVGVWVHAIWVDSAASLWGGRQIWGVPKQLATFTWRERGVLMKDDAGMRISIEFGRSSTWSVPTPFVAPAFGLLLGQLQFFRGAGRGRLRTSRVRLVSWPAGLPSVRTGLARAAHLDKFQMVVGAPRELTGAMTDTHRTGR
ncbi:acetoacetate decarboxylase family protein [Lentzea alba]|uniref:acetoacetate decarboxylase family protein n=1 Tax=Lentzea alba TaxID=2714351 RepID=UPI0039BFC0F9